MQIFQNNYSSDKYQLDTVHTFSYEKKNREWAYTTDFADIIIQITSKKKYLLCLKMKSSKHTKIKIKFIKMGINWSPYKNLPVRNK